MVSIFSKLVNCIFGTALLVNSYSWIRGTENNIPVNNTRSGVSCVINEIQWRIQDFSNVVRQPQRWGPSLLFGHFFKTALQN